MFKKTVIVVCLSVLTGLSLSKDNRLIWVFSRDTRSMYESAYQSALEMRRTGPSQETIRRREKALSTQGIVGRMGVSGCQPHIEEMKQMGTHNHVSTNWLNGASSGVLAPLIGNVRSLPCVKEIRTIAVHTKQIPSFAPLSPKTNPTMAFQNYDYGFSYHQVDMRGVPDARSKGFTGVVVLDTGFELDRVPFDLLYLTAEYDLSSAERLWFEGLITPTYYYQLEDIGAWKDPGGRCVTLSESGVFFSLDPDSREFLKENDLWKLS